MSTKRRRKPNFRTMVKRELKRQGRSWYWLGRQPGVSCHEETIRLWLNGEKDRSIRVRHVEEILHVLKITRLA